MFTDPLLPESGNKYNKQVKDTLDSVGCKPLEHVDLLDINNQTCLIFLPSFEQKPLATAKQSANQMPTSVLRQHRILCVVLILPCQFVEMPSWLPPMATHLVISAIPSINYVR